MLLFTIAMIVLVDFNDDIHLNFSVGSGYYDEALELEIYGGGRSRIYYTLDGSEPTTEDSLYNIDRPIMLNDATCNENVYSSRTDISTGFLSDLIDQYSDGDPHYTIPDYNVDKCNIVRASAFDAGGNLLDSITGVYFIGFGDKVEYEEIYVASIVTDPFNLFDYESGIYTLGATFDAVKATELGTDDYGSTPYWWCWDANYSNKGIEWEREAQVSIFDNNKKLILSEDCGVRIQGGGSRGFLPKSIGCYAREAYGGSNEFRTPLFYADKYPHKFVFFSGGDDNSFKLKDYLANTLESELAFSTMSFIPCAVFLNGEYWGFYYITENYNGDYISDHYRVRKDNIIMVKNNELTEGNELEKEIFESMQQFISVNDMSVKDNYEKACELIDVDNYIDYYAAQIYIARYSDWPGANYAAWRTRENDGSVYGDCRWRWMLFDVNSGGLSIGQLETDTLFDVLSKDPVFYSLYLNQEFRIKFAGRLLFIGQEIFSEEKCQTFLDEYSRRMKEPIAAGNLRFYNDAKREEFDENVENTRLFFQKRYDVIWDSLINNMGEAWLKENGIQK